MVAETGLLLDAFLRSGESVHQSTHTSQNGNQLEITLTRLTKHIELLEAAKQSTVQVSLSSSRVGLKTAASPRDSDSGSESPTPRNLKGTTIRMQARTQTHTHASARSWPIVLIVLTCASAARQVVRCTRLRRACYGARAICPRARTSSPSSPGRPPPAT